MANKLYKTIIEIIWHSIIRIVNYLKWPLPNSVRELDRWWFPVLRKIVGSSQLRSLYPHHELFSNTAEARNRWLLSSFDLSMPATPRLPVPLTANPTLLLFKLIYSAFKLDIQTDERSIHGAISKPTVEVAAIVRKFLEFLQLMSRK